MNDPTRNLKIHIHKVDGSLERVTQSEAGLVRRILHEFQPGRIFNQETIIFPGDHSLASYRAPQVTRIDLITDLLSVWDFPFVIGALVELQESEFQEFLNDRRGRVTPRTSGNFPVFLEIEMVNGQRLLLWMDIIAGLPVDRLRRIYSLCQKRSLIFGLRSGGIGVLNMANVARFLVHPDLLAGSPGPQPIQPPIDSRREIFLAADLGGRVDDQPPSTCLTQKSRTNLNPSGRNQNENESQMEGKHQ